MNATVFESSAKTGYNIGEIFETAVRQCIEKQAGGIAYATTTTKKQTFPQQEKEKSSCC